MNPTGHKIIPVLIWAMMLSACDKLPQQHERSSREDVNDAVTETVDLHRRYAEQLANGEFDPYGSASDKWSVAIGSLRQVDLEEICDSFRELKSLEKSAALTILIVSKDRVPCAAETVIAASEDRDPWVKMVAITHLSSLWPNERVTAAFRKLIAESDPQVVEILRLSIESLPPSPESRALLDELRNRQGGV